MESVQVFPRRNKCAINYRPQRSWAKVMFLQASVILSTGGVSASVHAGIPHPQEQTPPLGSRHPPWSRHPPGADRPRADTLQSKHPPPPGADTSPGANTPWEQTPPWSRHPPSRHPQEQTPPRSRPPGSRHLPRSRHPWEQTPT